jgi:hypothetical protein
MAEKLILKHRGDYDYFLLSRTKNSEAVQASLISDDEFEQKLSKQNCDEIFGVIDVENLAENHPLEVSNASHGFGIKDGIVYGFNKAMELNKDKLFTLGDIKEVIKKARLLARLKEDYGYDEYMFDEEDIIQSIQQPTEIEVEIEMECPQCQEWGYVSKCKKDCNKKFLQPKLDENGCLILKKA